MAAHRVFAIYRTSNGRLKRWYVSDTLTPGEVPVARGESLVEIPYAEYVTPSLAREPVQEWVTVRTGLDPKEDDRYLVVSDTTDEVVWVIYDEPVAPLFSVAGHTLIQHAIAGPGWRRNASGAIRPPTAPPAGVGGGQ